MRHTVAYVVFVANLDDATRPRMYGPFDSAADAYAAAAQWNSMSDCNPLAQVRTVFDPRSLQDDAAPEASDR